MESSDGRNFATGFMMGNGNVRGQQGNEEPSRQAAMVIARDDMLMDITAEPRHFEWMIQVNGQEA
jgi:hypothetical protein